MNITSGKIKSAQKILIYGVEGIGKSTFASQFPDPIFIDTEGSTKQLEVKRFDKPSSWQMLIQQITYVKNNPHICKTLVIDTMDWAERLCSAHICDKAGKKGIEDFGYGNGFTYMNEEIGRLLNLLDELIAIQINVVITAHAQLVKFEQPDESGAYDRWELKLGIKKTEKRTAMLLKEWADVVLFANYKTYVIAADDNGKKHKAQGGERVMYTTHHPCWDAKNRFNLPEQLPFDYSQISHILNETSEVVPNTPKANTTYFDEIIDEDTETPIATVNEDNLDGLPKQLVDLMKANNVTTEDIRTAVAKEGYFPYDTPINNYGDDFINGCLIGAWEQVLAKINANKDLPFK